MVERKSSQRGKVKIRVEDNRQKRGKAKKKWVKVIRRRYGRICGTHEDMARDRKDRRKNIRIASLACVGWK